MPVLEPAVPARRELVGKSGGELELAFVFPFAVPPLAFGRGGEVRRPDQPVVEEVLVQDELGLELALV